MAPQVEASSLSDITQLAGNPPKYPRNPTEAKREPLTLYIARVPGSRDIILTTLKPQLKNVTAEDVASSLYYLHLQTPEDAKFLEDDANPVAGETTSFVNKSLPRKPLPESARSSIEISRQLTAASQRSRPKEPTTSLPRRKPVGSESPTRRPPPQAHQNESILRRPLGPRDQTEYGFERKQFSGVENAPTSAASRTPSPSKKSIDLTRTAELLAENVEADKEAFSITLIRRDPSSGAQWNIGSVTGTPASEEAQSRRLKTAPRSRKPYFDLSVHITTPGYNYFRHPQPNCHTGNATTSHNMSGESSTDADELHLQPRSNSGFDRQVRMEGNSFWNRSSIQSKRALSDISDKHMTVRGRSSSESSSGAPYVLPGDEDSQTKGYIFSSPWGGRCKFSTGSGGRSLRCKHTLPAPVSASNDPNATSSAQPAVVVSELRFNLPSSAVFTQAASVTSPPHKGLDSKQFSMPKLSHIRNKLSSGHKTAPPLPPRPPPTSYAALYPSDDDRPPPLPPRSYSQTPRGSNEEAVAPPPMGHQPFPYSAYLRSEEGEDEEVRLDLSIGQEKAGGGNRGKRAKLGKLIIHDEGFKMLDLVVASNMGIWWSVWESEHW
ncbi:hypothetical protein ONS95_013942 [Cadophora gregata]|uniref:uncharacterized protein n=1 Tax=Cadophora gregata TaxID=51156 RepID=UPI0026DC43E7|nr:uncharacterized protein ONS95_013942 [Cadophora gregata]KAK0113693.1 hypothetical protein ONS96_014548 [Cadophora gregata f. sp. sojae]KAK0114452.1 hypothetical protein ONS95_013942 [Cadophora gregata]